VLLASSDPNDQEYFTSQGTSYASATVAGLAAYFRGLDPTLTTAARVKQRIVDLAYRRPATLDYPDDNYPEKVVWNGQMNGESVAGDCSSDGSKTKRQSSSGGSGSCPVAWPPEAPSLTFRTGPAQPTCAGAGCGSSCAGFFCAGSPLKQNPDFLDPRNPDSVQNPDSPYYKDWDGTITRTTTTTTKTTSTPTSTPTEDPGVPIGGTCSYNGQCEGNCPKGQLLACNNGVCSCTPDQNIPPYGTLCQWLQDCTDVYWCALGDTMVCETRDYSNGNKVCLCIKGSSS
jgi:hypothetical protein